ncbi:MAG: DUF1330 domain-containing protein [Desulfovibrio sp.]|nr:DUF1330 domain-containing protein [Desulfovibrio sp.]MBQ2516866.1 DUF1330 domain-containing protein [Desulfovibrio sp.]
MSIPLRSPKRVIIIEFPDHERLQACFSSDEYKSIEQKRMGSVDARAVFAKKEA